MEDTKKVWFGVNESSQFGQLLQRLVNNPLIGTSEICSSWKSRGRNGEETSLTATRAAFLVDLVAESMGTPDEKARPSRGVAVLHDVAQRLRSEEPGYVVNVETAPAPVAMKLPTLASLPAVPAQTSSPEEGATKDVHFVFPDAPAVPSASKSFRKPSWYSDMAAALSDGRHVSLEGPPGVGKSTAPEQWFIKNNQPFVVVNASGGLRERNITGTSELVGGKTFFSVAQFAAAAINGWGCILNEVNAADPDVLLYINGVIEVPHQVTLHGRSFPVHPNFRLVVTYNHALAGTKPLNAAFKDRFESFKVPFPSLTDLMGILEANGLDHSKINTTQKSKLIQFANACVSLHAEGKMMYQITPRRLSAAVRYMQNGKGLKEAIELGVVNCIDKHTDVIQVRIAMTRADIIG